MLFLFTHLTVEGFIYLHPRGIRVGPCQCARADSLGGARVPSVSYPWSGRNFSRYPRRDKVGYGGILGDPGRYRVREIPGDTGRYREIRHTGGYGEILEMRGDMWRYGEIDRGR